MLIVYSYKFICVYIVSFYANTTKIRTRSYHCRFTQSKRDNESHVAEKRIVLMTCCKWSSFQRAEYNHYWWDSYDKNHLAEEAIFDLLFHWMTMTIHSNVFENLLLVWLLYYKSHVVWQSVNKIQATLQMTGQAVTKKWFVKMNLSW